eukprot:GHVS01012347.1.p2 GENE.GHVS01012347.1~~GHVS01012347.1.p2  ORF type:complete len:224 (-),score=24.13 GHVS01012347.1:1598-2269(-)
MRELLDESHVRTDKDRRKRQEKGSRALWVDEEVPERPLQGAEAFFLLHSPRIQVTVGNEDIEVVMDTGANCNLCGPAAAKKINLELTEARRSIRGIGQADAIVSKPASICFRKQNTKAEFLVLESQPELPAIFDKDNGGQRTDQRKALMPPGPVDDWGNPYQLTSLKKTATSFYTSMTDEVASECQAQVKHLVETGLLVPSKSDWAAAPPAVALGRSKVRGLI